jgi:hypothetical protein
MSAEIVSAENGIITLKVTGQLTQPELAQAQRTMGAILRMKGKMRILVLVEDFQGWDKAGNWGDVSFLNEHDQNMERMAIVADEKWKGMTFMFTGKGLRRCLIEHFKPEDAAKATAWLMESAP